MVELLPTPQYGESVSLTHPDDAASLFVYYQGIVELLPTPQYGKSVSLTHPDDAVSPTPQPPTPPVPYAVYLHQWDGRMGWRGEGGGGLKGDGRERGNRPRKRYKAD